jgi:ribosomal protein S18 acetylase RimI-like enzyme
VITIRINQLASSEISRYLLENDNTFVPPLSTRLQIDNYAIKLAKYAVHFCVFINKRLVGYSGCYFNDPDKNDAFISTLSVIQEFRGKGLSKKLLLAIIQYGIKKEYNKIRLQVNVSNKPALNLYSENGFLEVGRSKSQFEMVLDLTCVRTHTNL